MKEQTLIEMANKVGKLDQGFGIVYNEIMQLSERLHQLGAIVSNLDGYKEAVEKLAKEVQKANEEAKAELEANAEPKLDLGEEISEGNGLGKDFEQGKDGSYRV